MKTKNLVSKTTSKSVTTSTATPATDYTNVAPNIYRSGDIYRVRITLDGVRYSKNFKSKRQAVIYRNSIKKSVA